MIQAATAKLLKVDETQVRRGATIQVKQTISGSYPDLEETINAQMAQSEDFDNSGKLTGFAQFGS